MRSYSVWLPPVRPSAVRAAPALPVLVARQTDWPLLLLGWPVLVFRRSWIAGLLAGAVALTLYALLGHTAWWFPAALVGQTVLATFATDIREWELHLKGFRPDGVVVGVSRETALLRYMDRAARGTGATTEGSSGRAIPDPFAAPSAFPAAGATS